MGGRRQRRLAGEPLIAFIQGNDDYNVSEFARRINTTNNTMFRYLRDGVPIHAADRICCQELGVHPSTVWPEWFDVAG